MVATKENMRELFYIILEDNAQNQRMNGLTEADILMIYEQSAEIIGLKKEVSKSCVTFLAS